MKKSNKFFRPFVLIIVLFGCLLLFILIAIDSKAQSTMLPEYRLVADSLFQADRFYTNASGSMMRKWHFRGIVTPADTLIIRYEHMVNKYYWE